ncbi:MAG: hypothetical protein U9N76_00770 [Candidatus Marinimicrobia bacterium]|nr:hypothetical protein [Candidatus Neomarinimicrobiota bacterium]
MKKLKSQKLLLVVLIIFIFVVGLFAEITDDMKGKLVELKGWESSEPEVVNIAMMGMKMASVVKGYAQTDSSNFIVAIYVGTKMIMQGQMPEISMEDSEGKMTTSEIDGFTVMQFYDKLEDEGTIMVTLGETEQTRALMLFSYEKISLKEALKLAKKFDWNKINKITQQLM